MTRHLFFLLIFLAKLHADDLPWLAAKDMHIVDEKGSEVILSGINLGNWLVEEMWMCPIVVEPPQDSEFTPIKDHVSLWKTFEKRFGKEKMEEIRAHYRNTWIRDSDFAHIKALGFNAVRLPFLFDLHHEETGLFYWLDHAVELAKKNGLYIILDMHGVPGRQSKSMHTGESNKSEFFSSSKHVDKTCEIWKEIAKHYKDNPVIAGYDLVNEPMDTPSRKELYKMYDKLYKAIRSEDKRHIIFLQDGYKGVDHMPHPKENKWSNIAMSTHHYIFEENSTDEHMSKLSDHIKKVQEKQKSIKVPYFLGEFNVAPKGSFEALKRVLTHLHEKKISYSFWSYKIGRRGHKKSLWAILYAPGNQKNIDPFRDSYKDIIKKIEKLKSHNYVQNDELAHLFKR